ncbi:monosaccharide-transporting ATPase [Dictyobacter alpinus]|uniref:Monosaccharide-transporting ATPase n=1 Tax=Dictyobacter alpinus TaxID=2014873 RepID=A0A402BHC6_9CHLR|nr:ABC transporter permease [Dictyobacter alpinus]GCE30746.1 monosaccharide-transporting ATPase [Dictyobacter alpinus]
MVKVDQVLTPKAPATRRSPVPERLRTFFATYPTLIALVLLIIFNVIVTPHFVSLQSLYLNLTQVAPTIIVATGMTLVIATGGIDLSVGSLMAIAGALAPAIFLGKFVPLPLDWYINILAAFVAILVVALFGLFNGVLITVFRIQPIIATLILFIAGRGIAQVMTNGSIQDYDNAGFNFIGRGSLLGIPFQVIIALVVVVAGALLVKATIFGRYVQAIGGNEAAARLAGIPVSTVKRMVYVLSGVLAAIAGLIYIAVNSSSDANQVGLNAELDAIAAVAVGGTSLLGGSANIPGTLIGALIIQLIRTTLISNNISFDIAQMINAAIILLAVYMQRRRKS